MLKEYADLVILGVTFDAKMTFKKHLCSVSSLQLRGWYQEKCGVEKFYSCGLGGSVYYLVQVIYCSKGG